jgi:predicted ArsR family transcriptional regulator
MLRITLTPEQHNELHTLRRDPTLSPPDRDRVEMLALSAAGWAVGAIAEHVGCHPETVRRVFRRFPAAGFTAVRHRLPGPGPDLAWRQRVQAALSALLAQERTWTAAQLAEALRVHGIHLSARQTRRYLREVAAWRRTQRVLTHKQDPDTVARAKQELAFFGRARRKAG